MLTFKKKITTITLRNDEPSPSSSLNCGNLANRSWAMSTSEFSADLRSNSN